MRIALAVLSALGGGLLMWHLMAVVLSRHVDDRSVPLTAVIVVVAVTLLLLAGVLLVEGIDQAVR